MIAIDVIEKLLDLERECGATIVRRGCKQYLLRRTYAGEQKVNRARLSPAKKKNLYAAQAGKCFSCAENFTMRELECDEFIPASRGGKREHGNIRLLCGECNKKKTNHTPSDEAKRTGKLVVDQVREQMVVSEPKG